jgi:hypothetical protein
MRHLETLDANPISPSFLPRSNPDRFRPTMRSRGSLPKGFNGIFEHSPTKEAGPEGHPADDLLY